MSEGRTGRYSRKMKNVFRKEQQAFAQVLVVAPPQRGRIPSFQAGCRIGSQWQNVQRRLECIETILLPQHGKELWAERPVTEKLRHVVRRGASASEAMDRSFSMRVIEGDFSFCGFALRLRSCFRAPAAPAAPLQPSAEWKRILVRSLRGFEGPLFHPRNPKAGLSGIPASAPRECTWAKLLPGMRPSFFKRQRYALLLLTRCGGLRFRVTRQSVRLKGSA